MEECKHRWVRLVAQKRKEFIPTSLFTCLACGVLKVGKRTIRISRNRLDMGNKPIRNASEVIIASRLRIPVGTNMFS